MALFDRLKGPEGLWFTWETPATAVLGLGPDELYRTQPNLRAVVSYIADNIADLPIKVYRRESDTDRPRVTDSTTALLLKQPNPDSTTYEFIRALVTALALYDRAFVLIARDPKAPSGWQMRILPDSWVARIEGTGWAPQSITVRTTGAADIQIPAGDFIYFHGYDPRSPREGCSPVDSLKATLTEQIEAERFRRQLWKRGGRMNMYVTRPKDVRAWDRNTAKKWAAEFRAAFTGDNGTEAGGVPVLEDGMELKTVQVNAREAQWAEAVTLSRSAVAAAYHINQALIWHDTAQTYASAKDNARALYAEALGPWLTMIAQRLNTFLLPKIGADPAEYVEFDIQRKLAGSFEERAQVIQTSVGAPWITRNEARAMNNLPAIEGGDDLVVPLNVLVGGQASPTDSAPKAGPVEEKAAEFPDDGVVIAEYDDGGLAEALQGKAPEIGETAPPIELKAAPSEELEKGYAAIYERFFERQARSVLSRIPKKDTAGADWWDYERWTRELADDLEPLTRKETEAKAREVFSALGIDPDTYSVPLTAKYIRKLCESRAAAANETMEQALVEDQDSAEPDPRAVYEHTAPTIAERSGRSIAAAALAFAVMEGVQQATNAGAKPRSITKTWVTHSLHPRASHAAMNGETVPYSERFSNGARFPQDVTLDAAEAVNCECTITVRVER